jgi:hypothetical protein
MGEYEVEVDGTRKEVLNTIEDLPSLIMNVRKAFENVKPKTVTTLTVKTGSQREQADAHKYPRIMRTENCDDAILRTLETDWGKWRPRTTDELKDALKANGLDYSGHALEGVLMSLVKSGKVRRWNTDEGYVYILVEKEVLP